MATANNSTKQHIIHAAKKLFAQNSYGAVSTRRIASDAKIGQSGIFFYFPSKEDLASAVIEDILKYHRRYYDPINEKINAALDSGSLTPEGALKLLREFLDIQFDIAFNPVNQYALSFSLSDRGMPDEVIRPLRDDVKSSIEIPMARLLCVAKNSSDMSAAYTLCHVINKAICGCLSSPVLTSTAMEFGTFQGEQDIQTTVKQFINRAILCAEL